MRHTAVTVSPCSLLSAEHRQNSILTANHLKPAKWKHAIVTIYAGYLSRYYSIVICMDR